MFRVEFIKSGFKFSPTYPKTFGGALKAAVSKGFNQSSDCWDKTPHYSRIYTKHGESYVLIAKVDGDGCHLLSVEDRDDYRALERRRVEIVAAQERIKSELGFAQTIINGKEGRP